MSQVESPLREVPYCGVFVCLCAWCAVFGVELTTLVKMEGTKIPGVIKDSIAEVEARGS